MFNSNSFLDYLTLILLIILAIMICIFIIMKFFGHSICKNQNIVKRLKRISLIESLILVIGISGIFIFMITEKSSLKVEPIEKGEIIIKTELGDEFLFEYESKNFPDFNTSVYIKQLPEKNKVGFYGYEKEFSRPQIVVKINNNDMICYEIEKTELIYKISGQQFKSISAFSIKYSKPENEQDLVTILKVLTSNRDWKWIKYSSEFLLKAGDSNLRTTLEQYSKGDFTQEELELNKNSDIAKDDMTEFAKQVLSIH